MQLLTCANKHMVSTDMSHVQKGDFYLTKTLNISLITH